MGVVHETHAVCGKAGDHDLTLEYTCRRELADRVKSVVVSIPGGGWLHGGMESVTSSVDAAPYIDAGWMFVGLRHRPITEAPFPACRDDIRTALDWLIANADELRIDLEAIALDGRSAGGHLATLTAALEAKDNHPHPARAVVIHCPPMDIATWHEQTKDIEILDGCVRGLLGGTPQEKPELCREASPLAHVSPGMPPFLIFHGDKDEYVPLSQTETLEKRLKQVGTEVTRIVVRNGPHDLIAVGNAGQTPTRQEIFDMKMTFLRHHLSAPT